jgi:hypothetical protein
MPIPNSSTSTITIAEGKNYIHSLLVIGRTLTREDEKAAAAFTYFDRIWGVSHERSCAFDFEELGLPRLDLQHFGQPFS